MVLATSGSVQLHWLFGCVALVYISCALSRCTVCMNAHLAIISSLQDWSSLLGCSQVQASIVIMQHAYEVKKELDIS